MTVEEFFLSTYQSLEAHREVIGLSLVAVPVVGTLAAWVGKGGKTDRDGIFIANVVITVAVGIFAIALIMGLIGLALMDKSLLDGDVILLAAPIVCAVGTFFGIRKVFPLGDLSSIQTLKDVGLFVLACIGVWFVFKSFRGWGIIFFGTLSQLILWGLAGFWLMRRLAKRAFGAGSDRQITLP
ncbi:MAG: hypothetical protein QF464_02375 [Myxococcota bacterium]|nr:hypothetical protein [Myxococcota bacterium]